MNAGRKPKDDLVTKLTRPSCDGERLSEHEFDNFFCLLIVAGNETTRHAITHGMRALVDHPDQWQRLRDDPALTMPLAAEEILRYGSPSMHFRRTAARDLELRGTTIREGDKVVVWSRVGATETRPRSRTPTASTSRERAPATTSRSGRAGRMCAWARISRSSRRDPVPGAPPPAEVDRAHRSDRADALELRQWHQAHAREGRARRSRAVTGSGLTRRSPSRARFGLLSSGPFRTTAPPFVPTARDVSSRPSAIVANEHAQARSRTVFGLRT